MEHTIDESEGLIETRFLGGSTRNWNVMEQGPRDYTGTLNYRVQDFRLIGFALGSIQNIIGTGSQVQYIISEIQGDARQSAYTSGLLNPPTSFAIEDSKVATGTGKSFVRVLRGCIPTTMTLTAAQNEPVMCELNYVAQWLEFGSGASTAVTAYSSRPYLWSDTLLTIAGSDILTAKEVTFELDQSTQSPHYLNGSRVISTPFKENRNYTVNVTMDAESEISKVLYDQFFLGGSSFNMTLDFNADAKAGVGTGSQHAIMSFSGCRIFDMEIPNPAEGVNEQTIVIRPQTLTTNVFDRIGSVGVF